MDENRLKPAFDFLIEKSKNQGYVSLDDVLAGSGFFNLEIDDIDRLSSLLSESGIILEDKAIKKTDSVQQTKPFVHRKGVEKIYDAIVTLDSSLYDFIERVRNIPVADNREMRHIQYQLIEGNEYARCRAIEGNLKNAVCLAYKESISYNKDIGDCIGEACLALVMACDSYNPDEHNTFVSYISLAIIDALARSLEDSLMPIPANLISVCRKMYRDRRFDVFSKDQAVEYIMKMSGYDESRSELVYNILNYEFVDENFISQMHCNVDVEGIFDCHETDVENRFERDCALNVLQKCVLKTLNERERAVLRLKFGFNEFNGKTLKEIGDGLGISRERSRQIFMKALRKLSHKKKYIAEKLDLNFRGGDSEFVLDEDVE